MARLPIPGADFNTYGDILNEFLSIGHKSDGLIKDAGIPPEFFNSAAGDGTTDALAALNSAKDAAAVLGGWVALSGPPARYAISDTFKIDKSVLVRGVLVEDRVFGGATLNTGSRIRWIGGADNGKPIVDLGAQLGATEMLVGAGIENVMLDGNASIGASHGLRLGGSLRPRIRNVMVQNCVQTALWNWKNPDLTVGNSHLCWGPQMENVTLLAYQFPNCNCLKIDDMTHGRLLGFAIDHRDGTGFIFENGDELAIYNMAISLSGTGIGVDLLGSATPGYCAKHSAFYELWAGPGGLRSRAGSGDSARDNVIFGYMMEDAPPLPVVDPGSTLYYVTSRRKSEGFRAGLRHNVVVKEDFLAGALTSGNIGTHGFTWAPGASGSITRVAGTANDEPGSIRIGTGATLGNLVTLSLNPLSPAGSSSVLVDDYCDLIWRVKHFDAPDPDTTTRIGFLQSLTDPTDYGIYFEKAPGDTNWFAVCRRTSGAQTRVDMGVPCDTNYHRFRIYRKDKAGSEGTINFIIDEVEGGYPGGGVLKSITAQIPNYGGLVSPAVQNKTGAALTKRLEVGAMILEITGYNR